MENFKKVLKKRISLYSIVVLIIFVIGGFDSFIIRNNENNYIINETVIGFQFGLIFGIGILCLLQIIKLNIIIKDEKKIKILYNKENDERLKLIKSKAGMPMLMITSIIILIAAIISGYFNIIVFYTLVATAMSQLLIGMIVKLYYMKTI